MTDCSTSVLPSVRALYRYTIIHPGGLKDDPGSQRTLLMDVDDKLISEGATNRSVPRADVARVAVASLELEAAKNRSVDLASKEGTPTTDADIEGLFNACGNCDYKLNLDKVYIE